MKKGKIKIGLLTIKQDRLDIDRSLREKLRLGKVLDKYSDLIEIVDIEDVSPADHMSAAGICYRMDEAEAIINKFTVNGVDGIFIHHTDFGSEFVAAKIAGSFKCPVLLWGNPDGELEEGNGSMCRFASVGMFATGKILRRYNKPFDYIPACAPESEMFKRGFENFLGVCSVLRAFHHMRILQISTRPEHFWSVKYNEGELLTRFGIEVFVKGFSEFKYDIELALETRLEECREAAQKAYSCCCFKDEIPEQIDRLGAMLVVLNDYFVQHDLDAAAINCWYVPDEIGVNACSTFGIMTQNFMPIACETDVKGAIGSVLLQEAALRRSPTFFSDVCMPHPTNSKSGLLWHCGCFPENLACQGCQKIIDSGYTKLDQHREVDENQIMTGKGLWEIKKSENITLCRFDEDGGNYSMFVGKGHATEGPHITSGTYTWFESDDPWAEWESKFVQGPYIHHITGLLEDVTPVLNAAGKYMEGVKIDLMGTSQKEINDFLWCVE